MSDERNAQIHFTKTYQVPVKIFLKAPQVLSDAIEKHPEAFRDKTAFLDLGCAPGGFSQRMLEEPSMLGNALRDIKSHGSRPESHGSETFQGSRMSIWPWLFATAFGLKVPGMLDCEGGAWPPEWRRFRLAASEVPRHGQLRELRAHNLQLGSSLSVWKSSDPGKGPGGLVFWPLFLDF